MNNQYTPPDFNISIVLLEQLVARTLPIGEVILCGPKNFESQELKILGFFHEEVGNHRTYNARQYLRLNGFSSQSIGNAYLQGGVRWVGASSITTLGIGKHSLLNTTANQHARPSGIGSTAVVPAPIVTPHMIYARGIYSTAFGLIKVVPTPVLKHKGVNHFEAGNTTVWYHTRPLAPSGFESYDTGYPKVFDPTQYFSPSPTLRSSVFGDVRIRNNNSHLRAPSIDSQAISEWATVEARDKALYTKSFVAQAFGAQSIKNKSPSIFFHGLPAPVLYNQAIGYRIRTITPTGFDRLSLGKPSVIKTPQLLPRSYIATQFGLQWISNHTRYVENHSKNYGAAGEPTVWFRFRYATPKSWLSQVMGDKLTVTHGVREVIGQGFIGQGYGNGWVSYGLRLVEPRSIYLEKYSNHLVGRHQVVQPIGFVATSFGTRIIPEIQEVYSLGFVGVFGLAIADLYTKHLKTKGFATYGEQPAFRWGRQIVQNSVQYITQDYDSGNGLVPPKWSDWTAIENRNKVIGAIGTAMQRFGYAQVDNNARLLEPKGLIATRFEKSMIAYRIRHLPLQGVEAPYMAGWHIIHNGARVIKPTGEVQSLFGDADLIKTRRYYERIGGIDSFESGSAMVTYRIRTIDIEKRYSIAPPIIRLPTIDLHTRYVEFRGYETAKYGLASLSIHFRIITPRWTHRDNIGEAALKNQTPEILIKGHSSQEYGQTSVRTEWRLLYAQGDNAQLFGAANISDTKQHLFVRGFIDSLASQKHVVTKMGTNPYVTQNVWLNDESGSGGGNGYGIYFNEDQLGKQLPYPAINQNTLYPVGIDSATVGKSGIHSNNLYVTSGIAIDGVSKGAKIYALTQKITLSEKDRIDSAILVGKPRLSPHTIWAVVEAPYQAKLNHKVEGELHYVNNINKFGSHFIESTIRSVYQKPNMTPTNSVVGTPDIILRKTIIKPDSFRSARFGLPSIPFTLQEITIRLGIFSNNNSTAKLSRPPYVGALTIKPAGHISQIFGLTYSDNFIRDLHVQGSESLLMGLSKRNDTPFMWQGLRVGEHVPTSIGAGDTSSHGDTSVSLRIRELGAEGFDAFISRYELESFAGRMTVRNTDQQLPQIRQLNINGIEHNSTVGYQDIKLGQHYIRPDGNSDQFRKGGYHA